MTGVDPATDLVPYSELRARAIRQETWIWMGREACECGARAVICVRNATNTVTIGTYCDACASKSKWNRNLLGNSYLRLPECWPGPFAFEAPVEYDSWDTIERALHGEIVWTTPSVSVPSVSGTLNDMLAHNIDKIAILLKNNAKVMDLLKGLR